MSNHSRRSPDYQPELRKNIVTREWVIIAKGRGKRPSDLARRDEPLQPLLDFVLLHGNGVSQPARIREMVAQARAVEGYRPMPVVFNEDDHFDFDQPGNNFVAAVSSGASWGYFDPGESNYRDGYQCPPVHWGINTERKKQFFALVAEMTGVKAK